MKINAVWLGTSAGFFVGAISGVLLMAGRQIADNSRAESAIEKIPPRPISERRLAEMQAQTDGSSPLKKQVRAAPQTNGREQILTERQQKWQERKRLTDAAKPLIEAVLQLKDDPLRTATLEKIRAMALSTDRETLQVGLRALAGLAELSFDKTSFRSGVLPHLESSDMAVRESAWFAMLALGLKEEDKALMRTVAKADGIGDMTSWMLFRMEKGDLTGESGDIIKGMIDPAKADETKSLINSTWGSKYSPELESRLIELSRIPEFKNSTVYSALSTQQNKSRATIERLMEVIGEGDSSNVGRSFWGLDQGVAPEDKSLVAEGTLKYLITRENAAGNSDAWRLLDGATAENLPSLRLLASKQGLMEEQRTKLQNKIASLETQQ